MGISIADQDSEEPVPGTVRQQHSKYLICDPATALQFLSNSLPNENDSKAPLPLLRPFVKKMVGSLSQSPLSLTYFLSHVKQTY